MLNQLIQYGLDCGLLPEDDRVYTFNRLLSVIFNKYTERNCNNYAYCSTSDD